MGRISRIFAVFFFFAIELYANAQYLDTVKIGEKTKYKVINGQIGSTYNWSINNNDLIFDVDSIEIEWDKAGIFTLEVFEYTITGCIGESFASQILVEIPIDFKIKIPNVFTPNNDNLNDYFEIEDKGFIKFDLSIYNKYGNLLFHSQEPNQFWNGMYSGKECLPGVYYYIFIYNLSGTEQKASGFFHLFR